jgi:phosphoglycolate phosphatase-like HAD superfamily hydrolase
LQGQLVVAVVMGLLVWVVMGILGLPNVAGLALLAAVMEFLPSVGPAISGWIGTVVALFQGSTWLPIPNVPFAIIVGVIYFIFAQLENIYFVPRFVGGRVKLDPAVALLGVLSATVVFGALGVLLATPVIASVRILFSYVYRKLLDAEPFEPLQWDEPGVRIPGLVAGRKIEGVIFDLDGTLAQIDWRMATVIACRTEWAERVIPYEQRQQLSRAFMQIAEGNINRWITLLIWLRRTETLARMLPLLDRLRGFAPSEEMQPVAGVASLIGALVNDYRLGLITTRSRIEVEAFLAKTSIDADAFTSIITQEQIRQLPPHGEALSLAVEQLNIPPNVLLMVADSEVQLRPARTLGMATVGVTSGLYDEAHLIDADLIIDKIVKLEDRL